MISIWFCVGYCIFTVALLLAKTIADADRKERAISVALAVVLATFSIAAAVTLARGEVRTVAASDEVAP